MNAKLRAKFLVEKYGNESIEIVDQQLDRDIDIVESDEPIDMSFLDYWYEVKTECMNLLTGEQQSQ